MLKTILSGDTCANCRNCCVFEMQSAWELPTFSANAVKKLENAPQYRISEENGRFRIALPYDASGSAQMCPFLDTASGCTLPPDEKPFACALWPVRIMNDGGKIGLALYQGCPGVPDSAIPALKKLLDDGLRARILLEAENDPSLILPYHPNYRFIEMEDE